jgi:hypothetical protein
MDTEELCIHFHSYAEHELAFYWLLHKFSEEVYTFQ